MQPSRHLEWTSRALLLLSRFILHQLPASYGVEVDAHKFLEAISMNIEGRRYPVGEWELAPQPRLHETVAPNNPSYSQGK